MSEKKKRVYSRLYPKDESYTRSDDKKNKTPFCTGNKINVGRKNNLGGTRPDAQATKSKNIDNFLLTYYLSNNLHKTLPELRKKIEEEKMTSFETMLVQAMIRACETGDRNQVDFFLERTVGKVATKVEINKESPFKGMSLEELIEIKRKLEDSNTRTLQLLEAEYRVVAQTQGEIPDEKVNGEGAPQS